MDTQFYSSKVLEEAVNAFGSLPGIGKRTALRLVLYMLKQEPAKIKRFGEIITNLHQNIMFCSKCHNISDSVTCSICSSNSRDHSIVAVVENIKDVVTIENTGQYHGVYHVLGGIISPMDGVGPSDLNIETLETRVSTGEIAEVVLSLSATMEGDTTNFFLYKKLSKYNIEISTLSRGVSIGSELEYTDYVTLGKSIVNRVPFKI